MLLWKRSIKVQNLGFLRRLLHLKRVKATPKSYMVYQDNVALEFFICIRKNIVLCYTILWVGFLLLSDNDISQIFYIRIYLS